VDGCEAGEVVHGLLGAMDLSAGPGSLALRQAKMLAAAGWEETVARLKSAQTGFFLPLPPGIC
jgi:hypothetical protein